MSKEFNWDDFNKVIQGSTNICSGARADIERAIKAGMGENTAAPGEVWQSDAGRIYLILEDNSCTQLAGGESEGRVFPSCGWTRFGKRLAASVSDYIANGGKL